MPELLAARSQMAFTLGFHIILACLGVGLPSLVLIANRIGQRRGDAFALLLARRWSTVMAVTFAVGAVTGTPPPRPRHHMKGDRRRGVPYLV